MKKPVFKTKVRKAKTYSIIGLNRWQLEALVTALADHPKWRSVYLKSYMTLRRAKKEGAEK
jgi:hypothetical protein